ncbi:MAG TPA: TVP38/TMEM64 family protein [Longimicrobiaceae bacterium]|nr:TVP38/TMEM64 family protein [Longimicrobiaceae bacterium]
MVERAGTRAVGAGVGWRRVALVAAVVVVVAALVVGGRRTGAYLPRFVGWVDGLGAWGAAAFIVGYVVATVALLPGSVLTLVGGAVFGLTRGTVYVFVAATLGATLAFLIARHLARPWVERRVSADTRFRRLDEAISEQGFRIVLLLRLSPVLPFNLLNYALGVTRVRLRDYVLASIGMLPGTLLYVYAGSVAGEVAALAGGAGATHGTAYYALLVLGLAATLAVTVLLTRIARRALAREASDGSDSR